MVQSNDRIEELLARPQFTRLEEAFPRNLVLISVEQWIYL